MSRKPFALVLAMIASCVDQTTVEESLELPSQEAAEAARRHIDAKSRFYSYMGETRLGDDCGGYSEVYRLFILRTFSESEVIRIGELEGEPILSYSVGPFKQVESVTQRIDDLTLSEFRAVVRSSPFLALDVYTGIWGIDTPKYHLEWCSDGNYYAVEREWNDIELAPVFQFLEQLVVEE